MILQKNLEALGSHIEIGHLFFDTNFLIDSYEQPHLFGEVIDYFYERRAVLITSSLVVTEFLKGAQTIEQYRKKQEWFLSLNAVVMPIDQVVMDKVTLELIPALGQAGSKASPTDLVLGGSLMRYPHGNVLLITKNHRDFPTRLYELVHVLPVEAEKNLCLYCFYRYSRGEAGSLSEKSPVGNS